MTLDYLAEIQSPEIGERLGVSGGHLRLKKSWPWSPDHLGLEYVTEDGRRIPGQWIRDPQKLRKVTRETSRTSEGENVQVFAVLDRGVLLQYGGADRRLAGLAKLVSQPGASLIAHRPERRAVVELDGGQTKRYAKVVRPKRVARLVDAGKRIRELSDDRFIVPELLDWNRSTGVTVWSELQGISLYRILTGSEQHRNRAAGVGGKLEKPVDVELLVAASRSAGKALRELHHTAVSDSLPRHRPSDEICVLRKWLSNLRTVRPEYNSQCLDQLDRIASGLNTDHSPYVLLHRDYYDKQVIASEDGNVGLLDLDTIAIGEAALDLANALVHMELRVLQRRCSLERATKAARALFEGYDPGRKVINRLSIYSDASRLRLACVYSFRPEFSNLVPSLLARIRRPIIGLDIAIN